MAPTVAHFVSLRHLPAPFTTKGAAAPAARPFDRLRTGKGRFRGPGWIEYLLAAAHLVWLQAPPVAEQSPARL